MEAETISQVFRSMFGKLIKHGFNNTTLAGISFGTQRSDYVKRLLSGRVLGHKPLESLFSILGYEIHIVPIKKEDTKLIDMIDNHTAKILHDVEVIYTNYYDTKLNVVNDKS